MKKIFRTIAIITPIILLSSCKSNEGPSGELSREETINFIKEFYKEDAKLPTKGEITWDYLLCLDEVSRTFAINGITGNYTYYDKEVTKTVKSAKFSNVGSSIPQTTKDFYYQLIDESETLDRGIVYISMNDKYFFYLENDTNYNHKYEVEKKCLKITSTSTDGATTIIHSYNEAGHEFNFFEHTSVPDQLLDYVVSINFFY